MPKNPTPRQKRFLFSKGSPLSSGQKTKFAGELRSGAAKVRKKRKTTAKRKKSRKRK